MSPLTPVWTRATLLAAGSGVGAFWWLHWLLSGRYPASVVGTVALLFGLAAAFAAGVIAAPSRHRRRRAAAPRRPAPGPGRKFDATRDLRA